MQKNSPTQIEKFISWIGSAQSLFVHTIFFIVSFSLGLFGVDLEKILLVVTTLVSLEAIYMAIFIQMSVNRNTQSLEEVEEEIHEIQEDVDEIQEDIDEIQEDVDEIQEDIDEIAEEEKIEKTYEEKAELTLEKIQLDLAKILNDIDKIKKI